MSKSDSKNILLRLKADDKNALQQIFDTYYIPVCQAIHRIIKEKETVKDIAQDVFIKFWQKRNQLEINSSLKAYLQRMGINEAISYIRKHKKMQQEEIEEYKMPFAAVSSESQFLEKELQEKINDAIETLPPKCKLVFQLSRFEQMTYREIAEKLGISIKTVENQMGKALSVLRAELGGYLNRSF
ncbi:MAG TPA: RNA polymerase sigma-70 factor [Saprospiraceae bacterium]|nr:RNA polymerase sigma-70 factor [Saprospiraceae bacterium]